MVSTCVVNGCFSRGGTPDVSFFRFPKHPKQRKAWIKAVNRDNWLPSTFSRICSRHFEEGWHSDDPRDINYRPTIFSYKERPATNSKIIRSIAKVRSFLKDLNDEKENVIVNKMAEQQFKASLAQHGGLPESSQHFPLQNEIQLQDGNNATTSQDKGIEKMADGELDFQFNLDINLDDLIQSSIEELCNPESCPEVGKWEEDLTVMQSKMRLVQRRQRDISKIFTDCHTKLDNFRDALIEEEKEDEKKHQEAERVAQEAANQPSEITISDSDNEAADDADDDDVQFIEKTFDPDIVKKRQEQASSTPAPPTTSSQSLANQARVNLKAALSHATNQQAQPRTIEAVRRVFAASLTKQAGTRTIATSTASSFQHQYARIPPAHGSPGSGIGLAALKHYLSSSPSSQSSPSSSSRPAAPAQGSGPVPGPAPAGSLPTNALGAAQRHTATPYYPSNLANQERMEKAYLEDVNKVKHTDIVLSRRYGDVWEKSQILLVSNTHKEVNERRYKVKFHGKKIVKMQTPRQVAFSDSINKPITVGTRIVAVYKDDEADEAFYSGIIAEAPNSRNELRYLVFFDDGYAQYCSSREIHKVFLQSKNVWEDIPPDSKDFVKDYLAQYPERPMVRLHKGQTVKTEWKGRWWVAKVDEVDASLVLMFFPSDKRSEWIYRGSTRLEPLYTALANAEANRNTGKVKRHNLNVAGSKKAVVEYTRNVSESSPNKPDKKKAVARKSTSQGSSLNTGQIWEAPWMKQKKNLPDKKPNINAVQQPDKYSTSTISSSNKGSKDIASVLQKRLASDDIGAVDLEAMGTRRDQLIPTKDKARKLFVPHKCGPECMKDTDTDINKWKGNNPLLMPLLTGWERQVAKAKPSGRRTIFYRAPCGRRLRSIEELDKFLATTDCVLPIDNFCYDTELHVNYEFNPVKTFCDIKDISYGKENVPISCVNGIDRQYPDYVDYSNQRIPANGVNLNVNPEFLVCCDCTDNCRDKSKCACQQLTVESSAVINGGKPMPDSGYKNRRLNEPLLSGVYECNSRCHCDHRCVNRVVQNGLVNRLQVFKTEKRGWGLRCLDDIPRGGFICIYAGQLLTDQGANEDGQQYGDEYLAELDYMEVVERQKEGYESDVEDLDEGIGQDDDFDPDSDNAKDYDSDESYKAGTNHHKKSVDSNSSDQQSTRSSGRINRTTAQKSTSLGSKKQEADNSSSVMSSPEPSLPDIDSAEVAIDTAEEMAEEMDVEQKKGRRTGRSTGARYGALKPHKKEKDNDDQEDSVHKPSTRDLYDDKQSCYIMDAKSMGNIGRYLNHSCLPCAFVQNVFVDTHDLRFPWIAFFAGQYISAGTELTWDYNYEVGSVPEKVLYCYCGSADCRGRLL